MICDPFKQVLTKPFLVSHGAREQEEAKRWEKRVQRVI